MCTIWHHNDSSVLFISVLNSIQYHNNQLMTSIIHQCVVEESCPGQHHHILTEASKVVNKEHNQLLSRLKSILTVFLCVVVECINFTHVYLLFYYMLVTCLELSALADLMGPYGIHYLGEQLTELVSSQVKELKVSTFATVYVLSLWLGQNFIL